MGTRLRSVVLSVFLVCAVLPAADGLQLSNGTRIAGTLLSVSKKDCVFVDGNGRPSVYQGAPVGRLTLDCRTEPRWARVVGENGDGPRVLRVVACEDGLLRCRDAEGKARDVQLGRDEAVEFYQAALPSRQLSVPHVKQKPDYCGEACIEMVTAYFGETVSQDRVNEVAGLKGARGVYGRELVQVIDEGLKLETAGRVRRECRNAADHLWDRASLVRALSRGRPVLLGVWGSPERKQNEERWAFDHFVLLIGYDLERGVFLINDPGVVERSPWAVSFERFTAHRTNRFGGLFHIEFPPWRTWTHGGHKLRAQFIAAEDGEVRLRGREGREVTAPLKDLSDDDRKAVERLRGR